MFKLLLENFKKTNDCIILAVPLVIFMTITQCYLFSIGEFNYTPAEYLFIFITLLVWFAGTCASLFYMTKHTLEFNEKVFPFEKDRRHAFWSLFKCLFKGIGKLFLPMLVVIFFFFILFILKAILEAFIFMLTPLNYLTVLILDLFLYFVIFYSFMFWLPEIVYGEKNPFKALLYSVKNTFRSFKDSIQIYAFIFVVFWLLMFLLLIFIPNIICFALLLLILYYFIIYSIVAIFSYYRGHFEE